MLRLRTFGGVRIDGPEGPMAGAASQRRRLALLVVLAASERGVTRDQLVGYLWPDSSEERARHALAQLLYSIRRELGEDVVQGDALTLHLNSAILRSDVAEFRSAVAANELEKAAELYSASFLEGFFLSGCAEFERWADETRGDLALRAREVLQTLASRASERGELTRAVEWLRRLARLAPLDSRAALSLMKGLAASGDRAGALEYARIHEALVRGELEAAPDPSIVQFVAALRVATAKPPAGATPVARPQASAVVPTVATREETEVPLPVSPLTASENAMPAPARRPERWRWAAAFVLGLGTLAGIGAITSLRSQPEAPRRWVLIADAENATGDPALDRTMPIALAAALAQSSHVYPVPPDRVRQALVRMRRAGSDSLLDEALARAIAQREGVTAIAIPSAERSGNGFELSVRLIDPATGGVMSSSTVRARSRALVMESLDQLGREIRRQLGESRFSVSRNSTLLPLVTTGSLDALKKFADGGRAFRVAKYGEAYSLWMEAVALDSGFASAYASLGMLSYWINKPTDGSTYYQKALRLAENLPERETLRIRASAESWRGNWEGAAFTLRPYLSAHPEDLDTWSMLGYSYQRARRTREAAEVWKRVTALDSLDPSPLINLATVQNRLGQYADAVASYRRAFALDSIHETANDNTNLQYGAAYVFDGKPDSARAVFNRLLAAPDALRQGRAIRSLAFLDMYQGHFQSAAERLAKAAEIMRGLREPVSEIRNRLLLAQALEQIDPARGVRPQLEAAYDITMRIDAQPPIILWVGTALARLGDTRRAGAALQALEKRIQTDVASERAARDIMRGELLLAQGRNQEALIQLRAGYTADSEEHAIESLAFGLTAAGALDSAAARYAQLERQSEFGTEAQILTQLAAYWLGRVEEERGKPQGAREAYQRFVARWKDGDAALVLVVDARARIARLSTSGR